MADAWAPLILAYLRLRSPSRSFPGKWAGAAAILGLYAFMESLQTVIPGRFGDITDIILPAAAWLVGWAYVERDTFGAEPHPTTQQPGSPPEPQPISKEDDTECASND